MRIKLKTMRLLALTYLILPTVVFLLSWCRGMVGVPLAVLALGVVYLTGRRDGEAGALPDSGFSESEGIVIGWKVIFVVVAVALIWCVICGQGGFVVQRADWRARNAIFRDLITHDWPVIYPKTNGALCYYIGHWLPAAVIGRAVLALTGSLDCAWRWGNVALMLWTAFGIVVAWLLLVSGGRIAGCRRVLVFVLFFCFFGGLDVLGVAYNWLVRGQDLSILWRHMDGWMGKGVSDFQFSSQVTLLEWVFNQTVIPWVAMSLLLSTRSLRTVGVIVCPVLICAPFPFAGMCFLLMRVVLMQLRPLQSIKDLLSPENVMSVLSMMLPAACYLMANMNHGDVAFCLSWSRWTPLRYALFLMLEAGPVVYFVLRGDSRNRWARGAIVGLVILPLIYIGGCHDFGMRATIPAMFSLIVLAGRKLLTGKFGLVLVCFVIGAIGSFLSMWSDIEDTVRKWDDCTRSRVMYGFWPDFYRVHDRGTFDCGADVLLRRKKDGWSKNDIKGLWWVYYCEDPGSQLFYRYLARPSSESHAAPYRGMPLHRLREMVQAENSK